MRRRRPAGEFEIRGWCPERDSHVHLSVPQEQDNEQEPPYLPSPPTDDEDRDGEKVETMFCCPGDRCCPWLPPLLGTYSWPHRAAGKSSGSASPEAGAAHWWIASPFSRRGASRCPFLPSTLSFGCCWRTATSSSGVSARSSFRRRCCSSTLARSARCWASQFRGGHQENETLRRPAAAAPRRRPSRDHSASSVSSFSPATAP